MTADPQAILSAYFDGINAERYEEVGALFAPDGEIVAPGAHPRGPEEIARYFTAALRPYPVHRDEPGTPAVCGRTAVVEVHFTGALASGAPMEFDALDVFELGDDGRIARLTTWYDSHRVRADLAAAQALDGTPEATLRAAAGLVRRGRAQRLEGRWRSAPAVLAARAVRLDVDAPSLTGADLVAAGVRAGDIALVRAPDGVSVAPDVAAAAVAVQGTVAEAPPGLAVGEGWALHALPAGWQGLLVSAPGGDGRANAVALT